MRRQVELPAWLVALMAGLLFFDVVEDTDGWGNWAAVLLISFVCWMAYLIDRKER